MTPPHSSPPSSPPASPPVSFNRPRSLPFQPHILIRWLILGFTTYILIAAFHTHWSDVRALRLRSWGWFWVLSGWILTNLAHVWSGWVWGWILQDLQSRKPKGWAIGVFLQTNIAKYLPGNIWHFVGRVRLAQKAGITLKTAVFSVVLEALLMAAAATPFTFLVLPSLSLKIGLNWSRSVVVLGLGFSLIIAIVLLGLQPRVLNPIVQRTSRKKLTTLVQLRRQTDQTSTNFNQNLEIDRHELLRHYPLRPLLGELGFVSLRAAGFLAVWQAIAPLDPLTTPEPTPWLALLGSFSCAWLLGLIVPGAPGGIGVFEAILLTTLENQAPTAMILGAIALYRFVSLLTEAGSAWVAWCCQRWWQIPEQCQPPSR